MLDDVAGELVLAEKYFAGVFFFEQRDLLFAVRAHDRFDARVDGARDLDHAPDIERIGGRDHQHARAVDMGLNQYVGIGSVAGDLGFSELTIRAMLGHASQNVTQDYVHIDEALKLAVRRTSDEIERLLALGAAKLETMRHAA